MAEEEAGRESKRDGRPFVQSSPLRLTVQDYRAAARFMPGFRRRGRFGLAMLGVGALAAVMFAIGEHDARHPDPAESLAFGVFAVSVIFVVGSWFEVRAWAQRSALASEHATQLRIDDAGVVTESPDAAGRLAWTRFAYRYEASDMLLLYLKSGTVIIVPKRSFRPDEVHWLRTVLEARLPPHPELGKP